VSSSRFPSDDQAPQKPHQPGLPVDQSTCDALSGHGLSVPESREELISGEGFPDRRVSVSSDGTVATETSGADVGGGTLQATAHARRSTEPRHRSSILEALALVCVAFALALTLKTYVAEAYEIKGRSMEPSFRNGERVVVLKAFFDVGRTDVIVFSSVQDPRKDLIKRVIGLPGETVEIRDGGVFVNGERLPEEYVEHSLYDSDRQTVPEDSYYVLGDNRPDSHDSRVFKSIPSRNIKGKVVVRWWPVSDFRLFSE